MLFNENCLRLIKKLLSIRCLCLAGCTVEQKSRDGILAEVSAMAQGYDDIADLLNKLRGVCLLLICLFTHSSKEVSESGSIIFVQFGERKYLLNVLQKISWLHSLISYDDIKIHLTTNICIKSKFLE